MRKRKTVWNIEGGHPEVVLESTKKPGQFLMPSDATEVEPPEHYEGFYLRFEDGEWKYIVDKRFHYVYSKSDGRLLRTILELGEPELGEDEVMTSVEPPIVEEGQMVYFENGQWVVKEDLRGKIVYNREGGTVSRIIRTLDDYEIGVHETLVKPPDFDKVGYSLIFRNNRWEEIEDHRNEMWFDGETPVEITELGPVPSNLTEETVRKPTKFNLQSFAVEQREAKQAEGVEFYGYNFSSDAESNLNLMASAIRAKADPNYKVNWKTRNGFVQLDSALIIELSNIVTNWIEATFDAEMAVQEKIDSRQIRSFQRVADEYQKEFESIIDDNQPV
jgi:hypothetical protein